MPRLHGKTIFLILLLLAAIPFCSRAEEPQPQPTRVSLLTVDPGAEIYELDGHTSLRFITPEGEDFAVNWGVFDFNAPNFLYRFVKGETDYMAWAFPTKFFLEEYRRAGRTVTEQQLNLTPEEADRLLALTFENLRPENRTYRYNYIYDNCATRPLDLVERAAGCQINLPGSDAALPQEAQPDVTFRSEMTRAHSAYPWYQFGIDLALGSGLDISIGPRERIYQPLYLRDALAEATFPDGRKAVLAPSTPVRGHDVTHPPTPGYLTPMAAALLLLAISAAVALTDLRRRKVTRCYDSLFYSLLFLLSLLLTFLIFVSVHEATSPNWLYLWINPLAIIPAALIWIKKCKRAVYFYQICNFALLIVLLAIGIAGIQHLNPAFYPLIAADMLLSARYIYISRPAKLPAKSQPKK